MSERTEDAARRVFDAINSGDLGALDDLVTDDFIDHGSPFPLPPGPEGYRKILTFVHDVLQIRYTVEDLFSTDDRVVIRAVATGVGVDLVHGEGAAGKTYTMTTAHIYRTEGDKLAEHWGIRDELAARIQLGTVAAPDPAAFADSAPGPDQSRV
ncbi:ester cyclase [Microlunatus soli]|uniref:Predicted ester cyclase n=1 Tax=Microlunatus soli TaxID=630515 RepID=A0A1H1Y404_9ACTN|nr:ester cyclase [Microlunatus soli]SDT16141.1 Predicted ester cyclase [Microlunatus soli]